MVPGSAVSRDIIQCPVVTCNNRGTIEFEAFGPLCSRPVEGLLATRIDFFRLKLMTIIQGASHNAVVRVHCDLLFLDAAAQTLVWTSIVEGLKMNVLAS